jgi:hypothetical protein
MTLPNIFTKEFVNESITRLNKLKNEDKPSWGKMNASQMLRHLNLTYDIANGKVSAKTGVFTKVMMKYVIKPMLVNEKPYKKNSPTVKKLIVSDQREFEMEKELLIVNLKQTQEWGQVYFDKRENPSMGVLTSKEWNNMYYKHLDHHFRQFGI